MTAIGDILAAATPTADGFSAAIPAGWMQGRTTYGGLSTALALHAAQSREPDLPPLRSAQIAFIGPLAGTVTVRTTTLRRGRNAAFVQADIIAEAGLGYRATFVFMTSRASRIMLDETLRHDHSAPPGDLRREAGPANFFAGNFDFVDVDAAAFGPAELLKWVRLRDRDSLDPMVALMAVADALPPAAFKLLDGAFAPVSSLTWIVNLLDPAPATRDGWWLLSSRADQAVDGCSSQRMAIWNADGRCIVEGMQGVAIFA